jgi:hypothetical protein
MEMPRFPEFIAAVEPMRRQTRAMATADPFAQYFTALNKGDASALETVWPVMWWSTTRVLGQVDGHGQLRRFVNQNNCWLAERRARIETVASTGAGGRPWWNCWRTLVNGGRRPRSLGSVRGGG